MVQIILNADDFGKSIEQNTAIDDSFKQGLICSAGLIINGRYSQDAINKAVEGGYIDKLHLHVNLSSGRLFVNPYYIPLTNAMKDNPFSGTNGHLIWYKKKSFNICSINCYKRVYKEIEAQYNRFIEITGGKGNYKHIDFHLWYNLTWPVAVALFFFTRKFKISSVRYIGFQDRKSIKKRLYRYLSWDPLVVSIPSSNIDYYLSKRESFITCPIVELYCHPHYKNGVLLDDSPSYLSHERKPLQEHVQMLRGIDNIVFSSWEEAYI